MPARLNGSTSGYTELSAPAVAGNNTLILPSSNGSAYQVLRNGATAGTLEFADNIVSGTAKAFNWNGLTNNTSIDFTGIPSWVKRVTVMFNGVSTNGSSVFLIQLGSGSVTTTGYVSTGSSSSTGGNAITTSTAGMAVSGNNVNTWSQVGSVIIANVSSNSWVAFGYGLQATLQTTGMGGSVTLSGTLDRVRITTVGGTDTFDAGTINIMYE